MSDANNSSHKISVFDKIFIVGFSNSRGTMIYRNVTTTQNNAKIIVLL